MSTQIIDTQYEEKMRHPLTRAYYDYSDYFNFGYWFPETHSQKEACDNLLEQLLAFIPEKKGTILDVACGLGATTRYLLKYYQPADVMGINISEQQLEICKHNAPGCTFLCADAAQLDFPANTFDNIICVEAAFHFNTRVDFLRHALRILKPGGYLVLSDMLFPKWAVQVNPRTPNDNWIKNLDEYAALYRQIGFQKVEVIDATKRTWSGYYNHAWVWRHTRRRANQIKLWPYMGMLTRNYIANLCVQSYLLASVRKEC